MVVNFIEDSHSYYTAEEIPKKLVSMTTIIGDYKPKFEDNAEYWLWYKALELFDKDVFSKVKEGMGRMPGIDLLQRGMEQRMKIDRGIWQVNYQNLKDAWAYKRDLAAWNGSAFHAKEEELMLKSGKAKDPIRDKEYKVYSTKKGYMDFDNASFEDLSALKTGCYPELVVHNLKILLAGQIDLPFLERRGMKLWVLDYKTNDKNPEEEKDKKWDTWKYPLDHLYDNHHTDYSIQLSGYAYMMEQFGWKPQKLYIGWAPNYDAMKIKWIELPYLREEVVHLFNHRYQNMIHRP